MRRHRSSTTLEKWRRGLIARTAVAADRVRAPFRESEVIASWSAGFTLQPGHPWECIPCLLCGTVAADRPIEVAVLLGASVGSQAYYRPGAVAYLIHTEHGRPSAIELWQAAHYRQNPRCPCHGRSAAEMMSYPYHQL